MLYFNGVFKQHYLGTVGGTFTSGSPLLLATSGTVYNTSTNLPNLSPGQIGLYQTDNNGIITDAISSGTTKNVTLVMGSYHTVDEVIPNYKALQVPQYSKTINWNKVSLFQYIKGHALQNQVSSVGWNLSSGSSVGPVFYCGTSYTLKLEVLGDAAVAAYNKNIYNNLQAWGGCCNTDCSSGCTSTAVDAAYIMLQWSDRINQTPFLNQFVQPAVYISSGGTAVQVYSAYDNSLNSSLPIYTPNTSNPTSVIAGMKLTTAYAPTTFGNCTFTPRDRFEYTPLWCQVSLLTQDANPCAWNTTINTSVPNMWTELQAPKSSLGDGNFIRREYILSQRYRQQPYADGIYADNLREREIENDTSNNISTTSTYNQLVLVHSVPRVYNPTAVHSNDCYMIIIDMLQGTDPTNLINIISSSLSLVGSNVTLETIE